LECIGEGGGLKGVNGGIAAMLFGKPPSRAWVANIKSIRGNYVEREFCKANKDYADSNGAGTRGVYKHYFLEDGMYEINSPQSWKTNDRYFAYIENGELWRVTKEEAMIWLNDQSE
jgi:hypothetical protein